MLIWLSGAQICCRVYGNPPLCLLSLLNHSAPYPNSLLLLPSLRAFLMALLATVSGQAHAKQVSACLTRAFVRTEAAGNVLLGWAAAPHLAASYDALKC